MQNIGIDLGTTFIKTSSERVFPSGVSENVCLSNNVFEYGDKSYAMGLSTYRSNDININKSLNSNLKLNFLYALFLEGREYNCVYQNVVVGIPASLWKNTKNVQQFREILESDDILNLKLNGLEKNIVIENIDIVPEGSCAYYASEMESERFNGEEVLLLDWGSLTLNECKFFNDELVDMQTSEVGVLKAYKDMADKITLETGIYVSIENMMSILTKGLFHNGELIDVEPYIKPIASEHCGKVYRDLKLKWGINTMPHVIMLGAGSIAMYKYFKEFVPHAQLANKAQTIAAIGMGEMAGEG